MSRGLNDPVFRTVFSRRLTGFIPVFDLRASLPFLRNLEYAPTICAVIDEGPFAGDKELRAKNIRWHLAEGELHS